MKSGRASNNWAIAQGRVTSKQQQTQANNKVGVPELLPVHSLPHVGNVAGSSVLASTYDVKEAGCSGVRVMTNELGVPVNKSTVIKGGQKLVESTLESQSVVELGLVHPAASELIVNLSAVGVHHPKQTSGVVAPNFPVVGVKMEVATSSVTGPGLLSEKYRPRLVHEVLGHQKAKSDLTAWFNSGFLTAPVLISGAVGIGKTSLAHVFVQSRNLVVRDVRSLPGDFLTTLNHLLYRKSVFMGGKHNSENVEFGIIIDEVQNMEARERTQMIAMIRERYSRVKNETGKLHKSLKNQAKRGGVALGSKSGGAEPVSVNEQRGRIDVPIVILICNDGNDKSLESLKRMCTGVQLYKPYNDENSDVRLLLNRVIKSEKMTMKLNDVRSIGESAHGDMRFALNTLQFWDVGRSRGTKKTSGNSALIDDGQKSTAMDFFVNSPFQGAASLLTPCDKSKRAEETSMVMCDQSSNTISSIKLFVHENYASFAVNLESLIDTSEMFSAMDVLENHASFVGSSVARGLSTSLFTVETVRHNFMPTTPHKQKTKLRVPFFFQMFSQRSAAHLKMKLFLQHRQSAAPLRSCLNSMDWKYVMQHVGVVHKGVATSARSEGRTASVTSGRLLRQTTKRKHASTSISDNTVESRDDIVFVSTTVNTRSRCETDDKIKTEETLSVWASRISAE